MKTKMFFKISIIVSLTICLSSCYAIKHRRWTPINNKQKALIKKIHRTTDTVYLFSSILDDAYIWYHDRGYIHLYHFNKNEIHFNREIYIEAEMLIQVILTRYSKTIFRFLTHFRKKVSFSL